jgi:uncharacterized sulfatase
MRDTLTRWMKATNDLGLVPEDELKERMRPGGQWAVTAAPVITVSSGLGAGSAEMTITCPTHGASIAYTTEPGDKPNWQLYVKPVEISPGTRLRARACRLGYKDSPIVDAPTPTQ